jgi:2-polyprenyl-6-methoxyphenol hydroxylase-like FAD-dependent oxidoreductase
MSENNLKVAIIGAGLGGLAVAIALGNSLSMLKFTTKRSNCD